MFSRLLTVWFLVELVVFIFSCQLLGLALTLLLIIASSLLGMTLLRFSSDYKMTTLKQTLRNGQLSFSQAGLAMRFIIVSLLLIIPGLVSSLIGLACLIPLLWQFIRQRSSPISAFPQEKPPHEGQTIEGEYWQEKDEKP